MHIDAETEVMRSCKCGQRADTSYQSASFRRKRTADLIARAQIIVSINMNAILIFLPPCPYL